MMSCVLPPLIHNECSPLRSLTPPQKKRSNSRYITTSAEYKAAKLTRRNSKASLTRSGRAVLNRIENKWSIEEIKVTLANVDKVYNDLVEKHEKFTELVEEEEFEAEERWLEECQQQFEIVKLWKLLRNCKWKH